MTTQPLGADAERRKALQAEIAAFLLGKKITGVRFTDPDLSERDAGLELVFEDGSEIELHAFAIDDAGEPIGHHAALLYVFEPGEDLNNSSVPENAKE